MKKYQLWLERKSYSQHLANLMKIKFQRGEKDKVERTTQETLKRKHMTSIPKFRRLQIFESVQNLGDVSFAITYRQLKNRKLRLMKSFQIINQNLSMSRRLKDVKSVFSPLKVKNQTSYVRRKMFQKKCELSNEQLREKSFCKFKQIQNQKNIRGKYELSIDILQCGYILPKQQFAGIWCELTNGNSTLKSQMVRVEQIYHHKFNFAVDQELNQKCLFRLVSCRGLDYETISQFQFDSPLLNQIVQRSSSNGCGQVRIRLKYNRVQRAKTKILFMK